MAVKNGFAVDVKREAPVVFAWYSEHDALLTCRPTDFCPLEGSIDYVTD